MANPGVVVQTSEIPVATAIPFNTGNAFIVGRADWGPVNQATPVDSLGRAAQIIGAPTLAGVNAARSTTNATLFDSLDTFFREGPPGAAAYICRVTGPSPVNASLVLHDNAAGTALTLTAAYPGVGGNGIYVSVTTSGPNFTINLSDSSGNILYSTGSLASNAAAVTALASSGYVTAATGAGSTPTTLSATPMTGGDDGFGSATITHWTNALNSFGPNLGPGQVLAPGQTNTNLSGIWSALGTHALNNNRVALCDMDDNQSAATLVTAIGSFGGSSVAGYCGFWAGNLRIPGIVPGTTRVVAPSPVIAGLCAQVDANGNPNAAAAGPNYPPTYATVYNSIVSGSTQPYSATDISTLNNAGINVFATKFGVVENDGFVSAVLPTSDLIFWQLNHARLRMAIATQAQIVGQPYVFAQIDGQGAVIAAFNADLQNMLTTFYNVGALYGVTADLAFTVDTTTPNTPQTLAAGQLNANLEVEMSGFAQTVTIGVNVVSTTVVL